MKAAVYYENGPPSVLKYEDVPDPVCLPQGIVIKVEAVSIEGGDTLNRAGGELATRPHIVGYQAAGTIVEVGADIQKFCKYLKVEHLEDLAASKFTAAKQALEAKRAK